MKSEPSKPQTPNRGAVLCSAFVFPGIGQFMQKRPIAGSAFAGLFSMCFAAFAYYAGRIIITFYRLGIRFDTYDAPELPLSPMIIAFSSAIIIYIVNIIDVTMAKPRP